MSAITNPMAITLPCELNQSLFLLATFCCRASDRCRRNEPGEGLSVVDASVDGAGVDVVDDADAEVDASFGESTGVMAAAMLVTVATGSVFSASVVFSEAGTAEGDSAGPCLSVSVATFTALAMALGRPFGEASVAGSVAGSFAAAGFAGSSVAAGAAEGASVSESFAFEVLPAARPAVEKPLDVSNNPAGTCDQVLGALVAKGVPLEGIAVGKGDIGNGPGPAGISTVGVAGDLAPVGAAVSRFASAN